jgi:uncharacterized protein (UPF0297 family)
MDETMKFNFKGGNEIDPKDLLFHVYEALKEKGYNPINQIVGYLISGSGKWNGMKLSKNSSNTIWVWKGRINKKGIGKWIWMNSLQST